MDTELLVEDQIRSGEALVERLCQDGINVVAAFWAKTSAPDETWHLYIASRLVDDQGQAAAYRTIYGILPSLHASSILPFDIKIIGANDPITQGVLSLQNRFAGRLPTRFQGPQLGPLSVDEAYIYSIPTPGRADQLLSPDEVIRRVLARMNRTGPIEPSTVKSTAGQTFEGIPISLDSNASGLTVRFIDTEQQLQRVLAVDEIASFD